jgi:crotonobetainyl-CoA:carnitine CoA-transferase CaiB-like acyl-CoA transferase
LLRSNPRLVVLSISGLGADAEPSERAQPSFDLTIQARAGAMSINGQPGGAPTRLGIPTGDLAGALFGCIGILASLLRRERTGAGQIVDASLLESQLFLLGTWISLASLGGAAPEPAGSAHPSAMPYDAYEAADGFFVVAVFTDRFWPPFAEAIGRADLAANVNYATGPERVRRRADLDAILRPLFRSKPRADWIAQFRERGIPAEPVATIPEALADPVLRARGMLRSSSGSPALARIAFPAKFDGAAFFPNDAPAALGSARDAVLAEWLGLSRSEIGRLEQRGAFGPHPGSQHAPPPAAG